MNESVLHLEGEFFDIGLFFLLKWKIIHRNFKQNKKVLNKGIHYQRRSLLLVIPLKIRYPPKTPPRTPKTHKRKSLPIFFDQYETISS